jgi:hypothetical protein
MISMTYDPLRETLRFAWRNDPLGFAASGISSSLEAKRTGRSPSLSSPLQSSSCSGKKLR